MDSYAFSDKLMVANAGSVLIGYSTNKLQLDNQRYFTIRACSYQSWVKLFDKVFKKTKKKTKKEASGPAASGPAASASGPAADDEPGAADEAGPAANGPDSTLEHFFMFDTFDVKKEYKCTVDCERQMFTVNKKFDKKEVIILNANEIVEVLSMLSFFLIPCLGLPPAISVCFSYIIDHLATEYNEEEWEKNEQRYILELCCSAAANFSMENDGIDGHACYNAISKFITFIPSLVKLRLTRQIYAD